MQLNHTTHIPPPLSHIPNPPRKLYIQGTYTPTSYGVAVIGTRHPLISSEQKAFIFSYICAQHGITIISGLAYGIDAAAHTGALAAKKPTWAVCAHGLDRIYPKTHTPLAHAILDGGGALISEYPPHTPPLPKQFLQRNRIISGLASAVVIIEAPRRSGTLNTARHALEQGRDVYVLAPPHKHTERFQGSADLIADGAIPIQSAEDFLSLHTFYPLT